MEAYAPFILTFAVGLYALIQSIYNKQKLEAFKDALAVIDDTLKRIQTTVDWNKTQINSATTHIEALEKDVAHTTANSISIHDKTYTTVMKVLEDAASQSSEGLFLVRHMPSGTYLWKVDKKEIVELSPKEIKK